MKSLYSLTNELRTIEEKMENGEELNEQEILSLQTEILEKTDNCVGYMMSLEDFEKALSERKKQVDIALKAVRSKLERFEDYTLKCMNNIGTQSIQGKSSIIKTRKPVDIVEITNENDIPMQYLKTETITSLDKKALLDDLKKGIEVEGAKLSKGKVGLIYKFGV